MISVDIILLEIMEYLSENFCKYWNLSINYLCENLKRFRDYSLNIL